MECWWVYDLATGQALAKVPPMAEENGFCRVLHAAPVNVTPLAIVNWWHFDFERNRNAGPGAGFTLVDLTDVRKPRTVWSKIIPGDYKDQRLWDQIDRGGAILRCNEPRRFTLRFVWDDQRVTFEAAPDGAGGWIVKGVARVPYSPAP